MRGDTLESVLRRYLKTHTEDMMFSDADNNRVQVLADKCTEGELSAAERREYKAYIEAGELVSLINARAIQRAKKPSSARR